MSGSTAGDATAGDATAGDATAGTTSRRPAFVRTSDGVDIAYTDFGGDGPPLLIGHATGFCGAVLGPLARRLASSFRCITFDHRFHGISGAPETGSFSWNGFANDLLALVMELDLGQPFSFGHSCGGAAALLAEESNPGLFRSIYCYEPVMWPDVQPLEPTFDNNPLSKHALARRETFPSRQAALDNFSSKPPMNSFDPEALAAYIDFGFGPVSELRGQVGTGSREAPADSAASDVKVSNVKTASIAEIANSGAVGLRCRRQDEAEIYAFGFSHDAYMNLGKIRCPVTFAGGAKADVFDAKYLEMLATRASQASVEVLDSLDHFGPMQDPDAVAASINNAFGRYL